MDQLQRAMSFGWLILAIGLLVSQLSDIGLEFWKPTWLIFGVAAIAAALLCWAAMYFNSRPIRGAGITAAVAYFLYWGYLFSISPPENLSSYLITGVSVMILAVVTVGLLLRGGRPAKA